MSTDTSTEGQRLYHLRNYLDDPTVIHQFSDDDLTMVAVPLDDLAWLVEQATELRAENERIVADVTAAMDDLVTDFTASIPLSRPDPDYDPNDAYKGCAVDRARRAKKHRSRVTRLLNGLEHNHFTRDMKAPGICGACDKYHNRHTDPS